MSNSVTLRNRQVGGLNPCFIIAEAGVNHNGEITLAHRLIDAAVHCKADAIKFQSFIAEDLTLPETPKAGYQLETTGAGEQYGMLKSLELNSKEIREIKEHCDEENILFLCTPYEKKSADILDRMNVAAFKIAATDTNNIPFLRFIAKKKRPVILSTGMSTLGEVEQAVNTLESGGLTGKIILLQCTSEYPAPFCDVNLSAMRTLEAAFDTPVGFSDHTPGIGASPWAVALGACIIEKHFTLDRNMEGPDHRASLIPRELGMLIDEIRKVEQALGDGVKRVMPCEERNKSLMQKSLIAQRTIEKGKEIRPGDLACKRPGTGLPPSWYDRVIGRKARETIPKNSLISLDYILWD